MPRKRILSTRLHAAERMLQQGISDGLFTHAVYSLSIEGALSRCESFGDASIDTVFDLASLTKPIATATAVLQLAEQGLLNLDDCAADYLEAEYGELSHLRNVNIRQLLTHTSGLPPVPHSTDASQRASRHQRVLEMLLTGCVQKPGAAYIYSDTGYIVLGEIVACVSGNSLAAYFKQRIADPLHLLQTEFCPSRRNLTAPTAANSPVGMPHDPRARALEGAAGHAGLFGTVLEIAAFVECIRSGGELLLGTNMAASMRESQIPPELGGQSYGWFCFGNSLLPGSTSFSQQAFGHSGFTGTMILVDPALDLVIVLLTNRVINDRISSEPYLTVRRQWLSAIADAVQ